MKQKGTVFLPLLFVSVLIFGLIGYNLHNKNIITNSDIGNKDVVEVLTVSPSSFPPPEPTRIASIIPTKPPQPTLTKIPADPAPNVGDCSKYKPEDGLATLTITLKEKDGKTLFGDWIVEIKPTGNCPAILPYGNHIQEVIRQGTYTYKSPGFHPGQVRVDVEYHYTGEGFDVDAISGSHSREVSVSN